MFVRAFAVVLVLAFPAQAQNSPDPHVPAPAPDTAPRALQERNDIVSWKLLAQVELVKHSDRYVPQFSRHVALLNQKEIRLQGFIVPLAIGANQTHFILSAMPVTCPFCVPVGAESLVEVKSKNPVRFTFQPVVLKGKLSVMTDDPIGVFYRLTEAVESD